MPPPRNLIQRPGLLLLLAACSPTANGGTTGGVDGGGNGGNACGETNGTSGLALCEACSNSYCCTEIMTCAGSDDCKNLQICLLRCTETDQLCIDACQNLYPGGISDYNAITSCAGLMCSQACSSPPAGCSNVALGETGSCNETPFPRIWDCPGGPPEPQCVASPNGGDLYCCLQ